MELDLKNKKILTELDMNARLPHSIIAKRVRLSKQVVKYRIEKLEIERIIEGYNAIIDLNKLGETIFVIYLKLIQLSTSKEKDWIKKIKSDKDVLAVGKNASLYDLTLVIKCKNNQELDKIFKRITSGMNNKIKEKLITSEIESTYFNLHLIMKDKNEEVSTSETKDFIKLDEIDLSIIKELSNNCRISLLGLSDKVNLTPNGVKDRIRKLEEKKIIMVYKTKINYEKLGYLHFRVFLHLMNFNEDLYDKVKSFLKNKGNVESISRYIGYADIDFRCYTKGIVDLYQLISDIKDSFLDEIIQVDSIPIFNWDKINFYPR